jgi:hypothetical protein
MSILDLQALSLPESSAHTGPSNLSVVLCDGDGGSGLSVLVCGADQPLPDPEE